jgi:Galactosyltransferase
MKILIAVPTCFARSYPHPNGKQVNGLNANPQVIRETWARNAVPDMEVKFFYGRPLSGFPREPAPDEVFLDCPDDYEGLAQKVYQVFQWGYAHGFDLVGKIDDDTWVDLPGLRHEIETLVQHGAHYFGAVISPEGCGGMCYFVDRRAMEIILSQDAPLRGVAEDYIYGRILKEAGICAGRLLPDGGVDADVGVVYFHNACGRVLVIN